MVTVRISCSIFNSSDFVIPSEARDLHFATNSRSFPFDKLRVRMTIQIG